MSARNRFMEFAGQMGIQACQEFPAETLIPEERIRAFCLENKCGSYGKNYMCPPYSGSLEEIKVRLSKFRRGLLLQYEKPLEVKKDREAVRQTKVDFHNKILQMEEFLRATGIDPVWGMIGGSCGLCVICGAKLGEPCPHTDKARSSMEANGVDVLALLDRFGLDNKFHTDKIIWTGCILLP